MRGGDFVVRRGYADRGRRLVSGPPLSPCGPKGFSLGSTRWTLDSDWEIHWDRSPRRTSPPFTGRPKAGAGRLPDPDCRIADPRFPYRVFSWSDLRELRLQGNAIAFFYAPEDSMQVSIVEQANERNSGRPRPSVSLPETDLLRQCHLVARRRVRRISPLGPDLSAMALALRSGLRLWRRPRLLASHNHLAPGDDSGVVLGHATWPVREDPFSNSRAASRSAPIGERERLLFHHFNNELPEPRLSRSISRPDLRATPFTSYLTAATQSGYVDPVRTVPTSGNLCLRSSSTILVHRSSISLPTTSRCRISIPTSLENVPGGSADRHYQWGRSRTARGSPGSLFTKGSLVLQVQPWWRSPRWSSGHQPWPMTASVISGEAQLLDLAGDGQLDVVTLVGPALGHSSCTRR